jgi:hypothetical protein
MIDLCIVKFVAHTKYLGKGVDHGGLDYLYIKN